MFQLKTLPSNDRDAIARMILEELEDPRGWDESFARSPNLLAKLTAEAMAEQLADAWQQVKRKSLTKLANFKYFTCIWSYMIQLTVRSRRKTSGLFFSSR
ncbi:hypothetical protein [Phormidium nigroviride]